MTRVLLSSMKKELTLSVLNPLLMQASWHSEEPKREIWKELFLLVEEPLSTQLKNSQKLISAMLTLLKNMFWEKKNTLSSLESRTQDHAPF